ncbi:hypothetical protein NC652_008712 [Populus alba x Populus x berolinensis]|nr:hypothetical protein NC652_008712 [Populus alba x Populus x berolinensis]
MDCNNVLAVMSKRAPHPPPSHFHLQHSIPLFSIIPTIEFDWLRFGFCSLGFLCKELDFEVTSFPVDSIQFGILVLERLD